MTQKVKDGGPLSLREAIEAGRIQEFIEQEELRGVGPIDRDELDTTIRNIVKGWRSR